MKLIKKLKLNNQDGFSAVLTLLITAVVLTISLSISALMISEIKMVGAYDDSVIAYYAADAGIEDSLLHLKNNGTIKTGANPYGSLPPPAFSIDQPSSPEFNWAIGNLNQDQSAEVDIPSGDQRNSEVFIGWSNGGKQTSTSNPGTSKCAVEWTLITYQKIGNSFSIPPEGTGCNIDKGFYPGAGGESKYEISSPGDKPINCGAHYYDESKREIYFSPEGTNAVHITLGDPKYAYKLRFKCLACTDPACQGADSYSLNYVIAGTISTKAITIGSTGTSNTVNRRVTVDVNAGALIGAFDYVLYSELPLYKPSSD